LANSKRKNVKLLEMLLALLGILATTKTAVERENGRKRGVIPGGKGGSEKVRG
jgi:hypothetical protein